MNRLMQFIDFGGLQGGGFQNALATGLQMGQAAGEARSRRAMNNALAAFDPSKPETLQPIMREDARVGMQLRGQMDAAQAQAEEAGILQAAMGGNQQALQQLAVRNFDKWKAVDPVVRRKAEDEAKILGNAALDLLNTPAEQRGAKLAGYVQQMSGQFPEVVQIAQLPPEQLEAKLRAAVFEAQMVDKLIAMERPDYQVVAADQDMVNVRDPQALREFEASRGRAQPQGMVTAVNPQTGERLILRNGQWVSEGGAGSNVSGGF